MGELRHDTHFRRQYRKVHGPLGLPNFVATSMKVRLFKPETGMIKGLSTALPTDLVDILHDGYSVAHLLFLAWYEQPLCACTPMGARIKMGVALTGVPG
jgi:hypothetical protein